MLDLHTLQKILAAIEDGRKHSLEVHGNHGTVDENCETCCDLVYKVFLARGPEMSLEDFKAIADAEGEELFSNIISKLIARRDNEKPATSEAVVPVNPWED